tara:strand:+ start:10712 stop:12865 length:2154 start_codon:yes stop_codon:yes gene_type:complete
MITELNVLPVLSPAFNKNLLKVESDQINNENFSYLFDTLTYRVQIQSLGDAVNGFPAYSGFISLWTVNATQNYKQGDSVVFFDLISGTYTGVYKVLATPNNDIVILDSPYLGVSYFQQTNWLFKISRNKLPVSPDGTATFNANGFASGLVGLRFTLNDFGMFNVAENFAEFEYLTSEEFYSPIIGNVIGADGINASLLSPSRQIPIGSIIQLIQDSGSTYNGIWEVVGYNSGNMIISAPYTSSYLGSYVVNVLPKDALTELNYENIKGYFYAFNGALPKHEVLRFDDLIYDATSFQPAKFLTTVPNDTKMRIDSKGYIQFFQSDRLSCTQYVIDVTDSSGLIQSYIVNLNGFTDEVLGISVGAGDLNQIPQSEFESYPLGRGFPVIQECDKSYEVYLIGTTGCGVGGVQSVGFDNPLGAQILNSSYWTSQQWSSFQIQIIDFQIGGVAQAVYPTANNYTANTVTSQSSYEAIYPFELNAQTGGVLNVVAPSVISNLNYAFDFDIDFDLDFKLRMRYVINPLISQFGAPQKILDVTYNWDSENCQFYYLLNDVSSKGGFQGIVNTGLTTIELSEHKSFKMDWSCCTYTGARLIFQDRLGSMAGFNFELKQYNDMEVSTDGFESDNFDINTSIIDRGFTTIQTSYTHKLTINSDYITEAEMKYLKESFSSPNIFVQYFEGIASCIILPSTQRITTKENSDLIRVTMEVQLNGTNYSQRN